MTEISLIKAVSESNCHQAIKLLLYQYIFENDTNIVQRSLEKYFDKRIADMYFKYKDGKEVVIEIQNSQISVKEIIQRTRDYNKQGVYVLWILHGEGKCVVSPKYPLNSKNVKISMAENILHKLYGGRVYYVNLKVQNGKRSISDLFALHLIKPIKKKKRSLFKGKYAHFYYRDAIPTAIKNWRILCNEFAGYKIGRFYDKNIKSVLKKSIKSLFQTYNNNNFSEKKLIKLICKNFGKIYSKFLIYKCLIELNNEKKINFDEKIIQIIQNKVI